MTDVEKYGVFALGFVVVILGLILVYDADTAPESEAVRRGNSVVIRTASDVAQLAGSTPSPRPRSRPQQSPRAGWYRVRSPAEGAVGSFDFGEQPLRYPGEHSSTGRVQADGTMTHVVRGGETLGDIAKNYFGTTSRWKDIQALNPGLKPTKMRPGDVIVISGPTPSIKRSSAVPAKKLPAAVAVAPKTSEPKAPEPEALERASSTYVVRSGDTLGRIAQRIMGSATRVDALFAANRDVLDSPNDLTVGVELRIP
jgi:nucleoid-associated protein YgaU